MDNKLSLNVSGMSCGGCAMNVRNALEKVAGVDSVEVDQKSGTAVVHYRDTEPDTDKLLTAVEKAGYRASVPV